MINIPSTLPMGIVNTLPMGIVNILPMGIVSYNQLWGGENFSSFKVGTIPKVQVFERGWEGVMEASTNLLLQASC